VSLYNRKLQYSMLCCSIFCQFALLD
jgi:hypothetical protein